MMAQRWLDGTKRRARARMSGRLVNNRALSEVVGHLLLAKAQLPFVSDEQRLGSLLSAVRRTSAAPARKVIRRLMRRYLVGQARNLSRQRRVGWQRYYGEFGQIDEKRALTTTLVLKAPKPGGEKGVLYCSFEYNWMRLVANYDAAAVLSEYYLVGASSWSPTDHASMAAFAGLSEDPLFIGISNHADIPALELMRPVVEPVPILASDWVNPDYYTPKPVRERTIDILMVANFARFKRHWLLFEALREMPRNLRVVLVGRNAGDRTRDEIWREARAFGVQQPLEILVKQDIDQVTALQSDARISAIFSMREGSCVATAESLFAGSPVAMMRESHIGSKAYINDETGVLLSRHGLAKSLQRFLDECERYRPRQWALANISCSRATDRLNAQLSAWAQATGRPWTEAIAPLCWRYVPTYVRAEDAQRFAPAEEELRRRHGVIIERFQGENARPNGGAPSREPDPALPRIGIA